MKIFIISPNTDTQLTQDHLSALKAVGEVTLINQIKPFEEIPLTLILATGNFRMT